MNIVAATTTQEMLLYDVNCKVITHRPEKYELEVVECDTCGFHLGLDASYLEQVGGVKLFCPGCGTGLAIVGCGNEDHETPIFNPDKP